MIIALAMAASAVFLCSFRINLHCTQYSSFSLAVFETRPHEEESLDTPLPLIYDETYSTPIRATVAAIVLCALFAPGAIGILALRAAKANWKTWSGLAFAPASCAALSGVPLVWLGERASALAWGSAIVAVLDAIIIGASLWWAGGERCAVSTPLRRPPGAPRAR